MTPEVNEVRKQVVEGKMASEVNLETKELKKKSLRTMEKAEAKYS